MNRKKYRRWLLLIFSIYLLFFIYYLSTALPKLIPDVWRLKAGVEAQLDFKLPFTADAGEGSLEVASINGEKMSAKELHLDLSQPVSVQVPDEGSCKVSLSLLGFHLKDIEVKVVDPVKIMPLGMPVGIYIQTKGVMVLGSGEVTTLEGTRTEPAAGVLKSGDYILEVEGQEVASIDFFTEVLKNWTGGDMHLQVLRQDQVIPLSVTPAETENGEYKIGIWIRQDAQGIGTLSYVDSENRFGALGHGITDIDTSLKIDIRGGSLYESNILSIVKGEKGAPGEMIGNINYSQERILGEIEENNENGIFGRLMDQTDLYDESQALPVGLKQEIEAGPGEIRCCVEGEVKSYAIEIESIDMSGFAKNRDMVIRIVDEKLLSATNGIIQGMSGSPIIQNGKFIGVVTHVFVNDSTRGYGIFAEKMLK